jgi:hypothetical protein
MIASRNSGAVIAWTRLRTQTSAKSRSRVLSSRPLIVVAIFSARAISDG